MAWTQQVQLSLGNSGEYPQYTPDVDGFVVGYVVGAGDPNKRQLCWLSAGVGIVPVIATGGNFIYDLGDDTTRYWCNAGASLCLPVTAGRTFYVGYKMASKNQGTPSVVAFWFPAQIAGDASGGAAGPDVQKLLDDLRAAEPSDAEGKAKG